MDSTVKPGEALQNETPCAWLNHMASSIQSSCLKALKKESEQTTGVPLLIASIKISPAGSKNIHQAHGSGLDSSVSVSSALQ